MKGKAIIRGGVTFPHIQGVESGDRGKPSWFGLGRCLQYR